MGILKFKFSLVKASLSFRFFRDRRLTGTMSSTDAKIKKLLMQRSTLYKGIEAPVLDEISKIARSLSLEPKKIVGLFDKFMTISRMNSTSVTMEDVTAFQNSPAVLANKTNATTVFQTRTDWEDMDVATVAKTSPTARNAKENNLGAATDMKTPVVGVGGKSTGTPSPLLSRTPAELSEKRSGRFESHNGALQMAFNGGMVFERATGRAEDGLDGVGGVEGGAVVGVDTQEIGNRGDRVQDSFNVFNEPASSTYMMNTLMSKVQYLDERIRAMEQVIDAQIQPKKTRSIAAACQDLAVFCGRIVCDTEGGRLNPQSVMLEGSIATSRGARVRLDLQACGDYRLFPGQVVAIVGKNPTGFCIVAQEIVSSLPFPDAAVNDPSLSSPFDVVVAAGPFSPTDSLVYEPLKAIIEYCEREKPDALVLLGPFVDQDHPSIGDGLLDATFEDVFVLKVVDEIEKLQDKIPIKVAMMPSIRDVHHDVAFPQKAFEMDDGCKTESLPNPATMKYRGTCIACSSVDWLMSCTKEEISKTTGKNVDRLSALVSHIVQQQSYYPMFPTSANVCLDVTHPESFDMVGLPEIVLTPSDLAPFAKQATVNDLRVNLDDEVSPVQTTASHNIVCVNPGRATKGATAGTFAHVYVNAASGSIAQGIEGRCKVEIKKI